MTEGKIGHGHSPKHSRFRKGQSGNPAGRPPGKAARSTSSASAFDVVIGQTVTVTQNGIERALSAEEALQLQTLKKALAGDRPSRRQILKMIAKREKWIAEKTPKPEPVVRTRTEHGDPRNADEALLILGIAIEDLTRSAGARDNEEKALKLAPWAVQAALSRRRGGTALTGKEIAEIRRCTENAETLRWPRGTTS